METLLDESSLGFLEKLPKEHQSIAKALLTGWQAGGGTVDAGKIAARLRATRGGKTFTAGTLTADRLELSRVVLEANGMQPDDWIHWSDDLADIPEFDQAAKYPVIPFPQPLPEVLRIAQDLRDLARKLE
ncbi:MAG: hypothetical protein ACPHK8_02740 [Thermoplasmatota archaeon]